MHEHGLAEGLLSAVDANVAAHGAIRATRVVVSVGALGDIDEGLLRAAFESHKAGSTAERAELLLEYRPGHALCPGCGARHRVAARDNLVCPHCGTDLLVSGEEGDLYLSSVEMEA